MILLSGPALVYNGYSCEDHKCCANFSPTQGVHANCDADCGSNDGLQVAVHADQCGAYMFLGKWNQEIGKKSGEQNQVSHLPQDFRGDVCIVDSDNAVCGKW